MRGCPDHDISRHEGLLAEMTVERTVLRMSTMRSALPLVSERPIRVVRSQRRSTANTRVGADQQPLALAIGQ